jgi:hypothetical protein
MQTGVEVRARAARAMHIRILIFKKKWKFQINYIITNPPRRHIALCLDTQTWENSIDIRKLNILKYYQIVYVY